MRLAVKHSSYAAKGLDHQGTSHDALSSFIFLAPLILHLRHSYLLLSPASVDLRARESPSVNTSTSPLYHPMCFKTCDVLSTSLLSSPPQCEGGILPSLSLDEEEELCTVFDSNTHIN